MLAVRDVPLRLVWLRRPAVHTSRSLNGADTMAPDDNGMVMVCIYRAHFLYGYIQMRFTTLCGGFARLLYGAVHNLFNVASRIHGCPQNRMSDARPQHRNFMPYPLRIVCGSHRYFKGCETGPPAYSPYPRRLESLTICCCNSKGGTFYSVILRPGVLVRPELNSRPPEYQPNAQPTESPVSRSLGYRLVVQLVVRDRKANVSP